MQKFDRLKTYRQP